MTVAVVIVGKVDCHATVKKENMNKIKEWALGLCLLIATPFLMMFAILAMVFFKLPITIFMLYNEYWQYLKEGRKDGK